MNEPYAHPDDATAYPQLATERIAPAGWRQVLIVAALALAAVLVVNLGARQYLNRYSGNRAYWAIGEAWQRLDAMAEPVDWLLLGDSGCALGVVPEVLEQELGGAALNLCTVNRLAVLGDALMLDRAIDQGTPPRAVVVAHVPAVWQLESLPAAVAQIPHPLWLQGHPLIRSRFPAADRLGLLYRRYLPLYSEDQTLRGQLLAPATWFRSPFEIGARGHLAAPRAFPDRVRETARSIAVEASRNPFALSADNRRALEYLLDRAAAAQIPVYVTTSPLYEGLRDAPGYREYLDRMWQELAGVVEGHPAAATLLPFEQYFPAEVMENPVHLLPEAAEEFTRALATHIVAAGASRTR